MPSRSSKVCINIISRTLVKIPRQVIKIWHQYPSMLAFTNKDYSIIHNGESCAPAMSMCCFKWMSQDYVYRNLYSIGTIWVITMELMMWVYHSIASNVGIARHQLSRNGLSYKRLLLTVVLHIWKLYGTLKYVKHLKIIIMWRCWITDTLRNDASSFAYTAWRFCI